MPRSLLVHFRYNNREPWRGGLLQSAVIREFLRSPAGGPTSVDMILAWGLGSQPPLPTSPIEHSLDEVELGPPVLQPSKIVCLGFNYRAHAEEFDIPTPEHPIIFAKFSNGLVGTGHPIVLPRVSDQVDYEGELAVVIGRSCKHAEPADALDYVAGYSIINDVTARDLQFATSQFMPGKVLDTFAPMGPGLLPADALADPQDLLISTYLDGQRMQHSSTAHMVFPVRDIVSYISRLMTLHPGDVIATGTPAGVGYKRIPPVYLKDGNLVEVAIEGIGRIANRVVADDSLGGAPQEPSRRPVAEAVADETWPH